MKNKLLFLTLAVVGILLSGCVVQCLNPLFTEKEYISYPSLVGTWTQKVDEKKESVWLFEPDGKRYKLTHKDEDGHKAVFEVAVGKIGTNVFLCSSLEDPTPGTEMNFFAAAHLVPIFAFAKIRKTESGLTLVLMDLQWLAKQIENDPKFIPYVLRPNGGDDRWPLLTGSTEELQKFVAKYADDEKVFKNEIQLVRRGSVK